MSPLQASSSPISRIRIGSIIFDSQRGTFCVQSRNPDPPYQKDWDYMYIGNYIVKSYSKKTIKGSYIVIYGVPLYHIDHPEGAEWELGKLVGFGSLGCESQK